MKNSYFLTALFLICGLPLILCVLFWALPLGSIGPMVPATGVINLLALPPLIYFGSKKTFKIEQRKLVFVAISIFTGVFLAVVEMNLFIGLTAAFGIMDYQLM